MAYISSNANRFYVAVEEAFGQVPQITAQNRFSAVQLSARQQIESGQRNDKTGSRTFAGISSGARRKTDFGVKTYLSSWQTGLAIPGHGPLFQAALGSDPLIFAGGIAGNSTNASQISFASPHGLSVNQAVSFNSEIRFVASIIDGTTVLLNAPFSLTPGPGAPFSPTVTYLPTTELPSISLFDFWAPSAAVQRVISGAVVNQLSISVNGDFHEFQFRGAARDILDSASFSPGDGGLATFPVEPTLTAFAQSAVPGNLGQAWIGSTATRYMT
ncbi:MAG: hypothetical protein M3Z09_12000, partial [Acidobacteriota bacterium]|nr:hypothetical protein [Acidobacteriota bacterium]